MSFRSPIFNASNADIRSVEDEVSREKALQTVMAGQQAENLLDFDDEPSAATNTLSNGDVSRPQTDRGLISTQQIASAAKSTNPLDELMDLFSTASMATPSQPVGAPMGMDSGMAGLGGAAGRDLMSPVSASPVAGQAAATAQGKKQDDLLGLF